MRDSCRLFLSSLPVSGVSVTVMTASGARMSLCSSGVIAERTDELQFELGEGHQSSFVRSGQIGMVPDVVSGGHDGWPVLDAALGELPVGANFCVPIQMSAVTVGVTTLYRDRPLMSDHQQQATVLAIASAIAAEAVQQAMVSPIDEAGRGVGCGAGASPRGAPSHRHCSCAVGYDRNCRVCAITGLRFFYLKKSSHGRPRCGGRLAHLRRNAPVTMN